MRHPSGAKRRNRNDCSDRQALTMKRVRRGLKAQISRKNCSRTQQWRMGRMENRRRHLLAKKLTMLQKGKLKVKINNQAYLVHNKWQRGLQVSKCFFAHVRHDIFRLSLQGKGRLYLRIDLKLFYLSSYGGKWHYEHAWARH